MVILLTDLLTDDLALADILAARDRLSSVPADELDGRCFTSGFDSVPSVDPRWSRILVFSLIPRTMVPPSAFAKQIAASRTVLSVSLTFLDSSLKSSAEDSRELATWPSSICWITAVTS